MHSSSGSHPDPFSTLHSQRRGHSSGSAKKNNLCSTRSNEFVHTRQCIIVILRVDALLYSTYDAYQKKAGFCGTFDVDIPLSSLYKHIYLYGNHWGLECSWWEVSLPCICWNQRPPSFIEAKEGGNESSLFSILLSQAHVRLHIHTWLM